MKLKAIHFNKNYPQEDWKEEKVTIIAFLPTQPPIAIFIKPDGRFSGDYIYKFKVLEEKFIYKFKEKKEESK